MTSMRSVPVHPETLQRLQAFKMANLLNQKTYDQAVNELLDECGFPGYEELDAYYSSLVNRNPYAESGSGESVSD